MHKHLSQHCRVSLWSGRGIVGKTLSQGINERAPVLVWNKMKDTGYLAAGAMRAGAGVQERPHPFPRKIAPCLLLWNRILLRVVVLDACISNLRAGTAITQHCLLYTAQLLPTNHAGMCDGECYL